jgi:hypothetical protein
MKTARTLGILLSVCLVVPVSARCLDGAPSFAPTGGDGEAVELNPCLLLAAGTGSKALREDVTQFWQTVNAEIATSLVQQLTKDGIAARIEILPKDASPDKIPGMIATGLARERCSQLMQFTHELGGGKGPDAYFAFEAVLFGVQEAEGGFTLASEAFRKKYSYPMTKEVLGSLSTSEVASKLKADLTAAGVLHPASPK